MAVDQDKEDRQLALQVRHRGGLNKAGWCWGGCGGVVAYGQRPWPLAVDFAAARQNACFLTRALNSTLGVRVLAPSHAVMPPQMLLEPLR